MGLMIVEIAKSIVAREIDGIHVLKSFADFVGHNGVERVQQLGVERQWVELWISQSRHAHRLDREHHPWVDIGGES